MMATAFLGYVHSPKWFNTKYNINKKFNQPINSLSLNKRQYSTISTNKSSERLGEIIKEVGMNPIYIYEDLHLETVKKQILKDTKGLSGIYMIINKTTQDYYIGSAATDRFYARFSNHLIYFRGSLWGGYLLLRLILSNSGDVLKFMVPSLI